MITLYGARNWIQARTHPLLCHGSLSQRDSLWTEMPPSLWTDRRL